MSASGADLRLVTGQSVSALSGISDINQLRCCEGIIGFDAEISHRAFGLCISGQKLDGP
jgi:hypothetical protein